MEAHHSMECGFDSHMFDHGATPFVANVAYPPQQNQNFRTAFWTGHHLQMTLMSIPTCGEIGVEIHPDTDQFIRVEGGQALVRMGACREKLNFQRSLSMGDAIFVPAGTWHNILNNVNCPLKLSSIYAPPHHPKGTVHRTKADATD